MPGEAPGGLAALEQVLGWLAALGKPLEGWLVPGQLAALLAGPWRAALLAGPWRAGCAGLVPGGLAGLGWSLEGWLHCWLVPGGLVTLLVPVSKYVEDVFI